MKDELLEKLRAADPATPDRVEREIIGLGDLAASILSSIPEFRRNGRAAVRRRIAMALAAAAIALGVAVPLVLLSPLSGDRGPGPGSGNSTPPVALAPIVVSTPQPGDAVATPVTISGSADVFEATVSIRILDSGGNVLADTFTTATCGSGCRGTYTAKVPFSVDRRQAGTIVVFEASAEDGSIMHAVRTPVTLIPPPPTTSDGTIVVTTPHRGAVVSTPVTVSGIADVFEAVVSIRILDAKGTVLADTTTMATCGTGCRGGFSADVGFSVDHRQAGKILVFEASAKDGSPLHEVVIPIILRP